VLFVVSRGVALGRRAALITVLGNASGVYLQVVVVAAGLGAVLERSITALTVVKLAGAGYLVYLGVQALRHRRQLAQALDPDDAGTNDRGIFREGFVVGATNPKGLILFTAILPQFVDPTGGPVPVQMLALGLIAVVVAVLSDSCWGMLAGSARGWLGRSPRRLSALGGAGGLVMIGLGLQLAVSGRKD
jgi:threonine/homoserine/homoserine lactone efflux protein